MSKTKLSHKERRIARTAVRNFINKYSSDENKTKQEHTKNINKIITINLAPFQLALIIIRLLNLVNWNWFLFLLPTEISIFVAIIILLFKRDKTKISVEFPWKKYFGG